MGVFVSIDLVVVSWKVLFPWTWLSSYGRFCFHRLGCYLMESSLDLIRSYEMFHRLDRVISLSTVIPLIFFCLVFCVLSLL
jgi:hypothetical protein